MSSWVKRVNQKAISKNATYLIKIANYSTEGTFFKAIFSISEIVFVDKVTR